MAAFHSVSSKSKTTQWMLPIGMVARENSGVTMARARDSMKSLADAHPSTLLDKN